MTAPTSAEFVAGARRTVRRLEMRDGYMTSDPWYQAWLRGRFDEYEAKTDFPWLDVVREVVGRGIHIRRVRIVSEPVSDYIRFEYATTRGIVEAGEEVRWVPRRLAAACALPGTDCWIRDGDEVLFSHYDGDGEVVGRELVTKREIVNVCMNGFGMAWDLGIPHEDYRV